jgi:GNAT superfamily N-acetyltransferase
MISSSDSITIHRATVGHADGILDCLHAAFAPYAQYYSAEAYEDSTLTKESLLRRMNDMTILVALNPSGRVVATIACSVIGKGEGHLRGMAVLPQHQATGVADRILEHVEAELARLNCSRITLDTTKPLQRAMRFYERHGYQRSGKISDFFGMPLIEYVKELPAKR